jgi:signal transduction histidine kinase
LKRRRLLRWPRSLYGRLLALSALATLAALVFAAFAIGHVLERFVMQGLDDRLDGQLALLAPAVRPDGGVDQARIRLLPPFDRPGSGWSWRIQAPGRTLGSDAVAPELPPPDPRRRGPEGKDRHARPLDWRGPDGAVRHARSMTIATAAGPAILQASAPREIVARPLGQAMTPLIVSLALLGLFLIAAILIQLRLGLRPLVRLRADLAAVRAGRARHVPENQPAEIAPLAAELNALIDESEAGLANARGHVANLAHGLKTPLATLAVRLREPGRDPDGALAELVGRIDRSIRHHLGRARAAAGTGAPARIATPLLPCIDELAGALSRIHADRAIAFAVPEGPDLAVAVDRQDLIEMIGNLLDNAWRWAGTEVTIRIVTRDSMAELVIEDDGPGIPDAELDAALAPGRRLDEAGDGHGFGLSIARELAELNGGRLDLARSAAGGLAATLSLPLPPSG